MPVNSDLKPFLDDWDAHWAALPANAGHGARRLHMEIICKANRPPLPDGIGVRETFAPYGDRLIRTLVFSPHGATRAPGVMYLHGGAWMEGSPETSFDTASTIAARLSAVVVSVDYALTPEHPFPTAVHECRAVMDWMFDAADELSIDPARIAVWGDSAGANLAAVTALEFQDHTPALAAEVLVYPVCDFERTRPSYTENADGPLLKVSGMDYVDKLYCRRPEDRTDPLAAPLCATDVSGLPPTRIAVAECDPLRDDGYAYAEKLRAAGIPVDLDPGKGLIHGYLRAVGQSASATDAFEASLDWLEGKLAP